jgi:hypothetical protein
MGKRPQPKPKSSLWVVDVVGPWHEQDPAADGDALAKELEDSYKKTGSQSKAIHAVRIAHQFDTPWSPYAEWRREPLLTIKNETKTLGDRSIEVPVERGYVSYNQLVQERHARPFRTVTGEPRVAIPSEHGLLIENPGAADFVDAIGYRYYTLAGDPVPRGELAVAARALLGRALARDLPTDRIVDLRLRVAPAGPLSSFLSLGDPMQRVVWISPTGWRIEKVSLPLFDHRPHMLALPEPTPGTWERVLRLFWYVRLKPRANETGEDQQLLVLATLVLYLLSPDSPKPVLVLIGDENAGKSGAAARLQAVVDPSAAEVVKPSEDQALAELAANHSVINLDNVSYIGRELSDDLARLSTGVGLVKRKLYSDRDEVVARVCPWVIINGITAQPHTADLLRRVIFVDVIAPETRIDRAILSERFRVELPEILGGLLELTVAVARSLRDNPGRDDAGGLQAVGRAVAANTGKEAIDFDRALEANAARQSTAAAEDPFTAALLDFFGGRSSASEPVSSETVARWITENRREAFPKGATPQQAGSAIARARKTLERFGINLASKLLHGRSLWYVSEKTPETGPPSPPLESFTGEELVGGPVGGLGVDPKIESTHSADPLGGPVLGVHPASPPGVEGHLSSENRDQGGLGGLGGAQSGKVAEADPEDLFGGQPTRADRERAKLRRGEGQ